MKSISLNLHLAYLLRQIAKTLPDAQALILEAAADALDETSR